MRLDIHVFESFSLKSREYARTLIKNGDVSVNGLQITKAGYEVKDGDEITVNDSLRYVGRGGLKLERALQIFNITAEGKTALDVGASTGGFTDCLLQNGATKVVALDVGHGQLAEKLKNDIRVVNVEGTHIKDFIMPDFYPDIIVCDVSFISLRSVLPYFTRFCTEKTEIMCLFKPQFEYGKKVKNGIIKDSSIHKELLSSFEKFVPSEGFSVVETADSPITGGDGNKEFLLHIKYIGKNHENSYSDKYQP